MYARWSLTGDTRPAGAGRGGAGVAVSVRRPVGPADPPGQPDRRFNQLAPAAKVRPIGPHQIRHLIASTLPDAGYGVHEVAERLGHDPATLMRYYTRVNATRRLQATDRIAELMTASEVQPRSLQKLGWLHHEPSP